MKSITNKNDKGQLHGYQECYIFGDLITKCFFNNGELVHYQEYYWHDDTLAKSFYL